MKQLLLLALIGAVTGWYAILIPALAGNGAVFVAALMGIFGLAMLVEALVALAARIVRAKQNFYK